MHTRPSGALVERGVADTFILLAILAWWLTSKDLPSFVLPGPLEVLGTMARFLADPNLLLHVGVSFLRVVSAVSIAMLLAILLALGSQRSRLFEAVIEQRVLVILNSFPSVGWAILGVIWFQVSNLTVIFIQVAIVLPFCIINALAGFRQIDRDLDEMGRSFSHSSWRRFSKITFPLVMPFLMAGLRISYGIAWKIALISELFGAQSGLGFLLMQAQSTANASLVFAVCFVIVLLVFATDRLILAPIARSYSANQGGSL